MLFSEALQRRVVDADTAATLGHIDDIAGLLDRDCQVVGKRLTDRAVKNSGG